MGIGETRCPDQTRPEVREVIRQLEQAITLHAAWLKNLHRTLVCGLPPSAEDLSADSHCRCEFGRWYHSDPPLLLRRRTSFRELGETHRNMHAQAREILQALGDGNRLSVEQYDDFMNESIRFTELLRAQLFDVINEIYEIDPLTGVANRQGMLEKLRREQARVSRTEEPCSICMVDFDDFKLINDQYGHRAGDKVLRTAAQHMAASLRRYDSIYRYGGEEFLIVLPATTPETAEHLVERIRASVEALPIHLENNGMVYVTASFGIAALEPDVDIELVVERADQALRRSKQNGRNRTTVWSNRRDS